MPETPDANAQPTADFPHLSARDIVHLHANCVMSICGALDAHGLVSRLDMANLLNADALQESDAPWAQVVRAIALTLARAEQPTEQTAHSPSAPSRSDFIVIEGGASGAPTPKNGA